MLYSFNKITFQNIIYKSLKYQSHWHPSQFLTFPVLPRVAQTFSAPNSCLNKRPHFWQLFNKFLQNSHAWTWTSRNFTLMSSLTWYSECSVN